MSFKEHFKCFVQVLCFSMLGVVILVPFLILTFKYVKWMITVTGP